MPKIWTTSNHTIFSVISAQPLDKAQTSPHPKKEKIETREVGDPNVKFLIDEPRFFPYYYSGTFGTLVVSVPPEL